MPFRPKNVLKTRLKKPLTRASLPRILISLKINAKYARHKNKVLLWRLSALALQNHHYI